VAVLASDLPHVTASDVLELVAHARPLALVAAADGTTNAIAACPPTAFHPSYGPGSAARHGGTRLRLAGIERDVDTPSDLALACPG
jgi:2-phospho-L-lactate guanylyltransferase (CobY/MobA/RfbA family)